MLWYTLDYNSKRNFSALTKAKVTTHKWVQLACKTNVQPLTTNQSITIKTCQSCSTVTSLLTWAIGITPPIIGGGALTMYGIGGIPGIPIGGWPG